MRNLLIRRNILKNRANQSVSNPYLNIRHVLRGFKVMKLGTNIALDSTLTTGHVLINALRQSYSSNSSNGREFVGILTMDCFLFSIPYNCFLRNFMFVWFSL